MNKNLKRMVQDSQEVAQLERRDEAKGVVRSARERYLAVQAKRERRRQVRQWIFGFTITALLCAVLFVGPSWVVVHFLRKWW